MADLVRLRVVVDRGASNGLNGPLELLGPHGLTPGTLVQVTLGTRDVMGLVWDPLPAGQGDEDQLPQADLRPVGEALDALPPLSSAWRRLLDFAAGYYQRSVGELALSVLPKTLRELDAAQLQVRLKKIDKADAAAAKAAAEDPVAEPARPELTAQQQQALDALSRQAAQPAPIPSLLWGLTGSGKTEIYLRAAEAALERGQQVLVLVPEINLTPQLEARFAERFAGHSIVSLHSGLTPVRRLHNWLSAHLGRAQLVLGTRLAVFASMPRLGLIVVDEEHDPSYKQQDGARYSARDLAVYRGHLEKIPVVLGSATPSLESWQHALGGRYQRVDLTERIGGGALPQVRLFDMNRLERKKGVTTALSVPLLDALRKRLERGEQSLVFLNRRGYAPVLHCDQCNWKSDCPHCSAHQVFHKEDRSLRCHHCGVSARVPRACPSCGNPDIAPLGRGTERLEEQLAAALPGARVARIDADTTKLKGSLEEQLAAVHEGDVDILVGTQMIAKGHAFTRVTLVVAIDSDEALSCGGLGAREAMFADLVQAIDRSRELTRKRVEVWVQTAVPEHHLYQAIAGLDYVSFAAQQLLERRAANMPPYVRLARLRAEARSAAGALAFLLEVEKVAREVAEACAVSVYAPVPMPVARVAGVHRFQLLAEAGSAGALQRFLRVLLPRVQELRAAASDLSRWAVDVDPTDI